jgi:tetratricopeptide (TPR) repeat protein
MLCPACHTENPEGALQCSCCRASLPSADETRPIGDAYAAAPKAAPVTAQPSPATGVITPPNADDVTVVLPLSYQPRSLRDLDPGSSFGPRYRIEAMLGQGGMGKVYKAYDLDLNRVVALKLVRSELAADPDCMKRFKQELLFASKISHKNVLRIHDLGDVEGIKFISMAFVEGQDLFHILRETGRLPMDRAIRIARQLCAALEAAHSEGVVHRDFKPQNILIDKADNVYVSDFGIAKSLEEGATVLTRVGHIMGTPRYMAPEQIEAKPVDHRADLYAFGLILCEMVTGEIPFQGESGMQQMFQRVHAEPINPKSLNPDLPDYLVHIIQRCLEKDLACRYQNATEILTDLAPPAAVPDRVVRLRFVENVYSGWIPAVLAVVVLLGGSLLVGPVRDFVLGGASVVRGRSTPIGPTTYLAVLPFRVVGEEPSLRDVADGVVDAVSAKLSQLKSVYLASASAVETAGKLDSPDKIAQRLGVKVLLQGTVQGAGGKLSVVVNLYDSSRKQRLWSQEFPGSIKDLLTIEGEIYAKLLSALNLRPTNEEMTRANTRLTSDVDAYKLYLRARSILHGEQDLKNVTAALDLYNQAILADQGFALAYAGVADVSQRMYTLKNDPVWAERARGAAERARELNDKLPEVHFELGSIYSHEGKTAEAIAELKSALELSPNSDEGNRRLGEAYLAAGKKDESIQAYRKAVEVNPYYWLNYSRLGGAYFRFGQNEDALRAYQRVAELAPDSDSGYSNIGVVYYREGKWNEALVAFQKALTLRPSAAVYSNLGTIYFYQGRYSESTGMFEKAVELAPNQTLIGNLADAYRWMGQRDKANATYDRAINLALKDLQINQRDIRVLEHLGVYYAKKGDTKRGLDFIRRARAIDTNDNQLMYNESLILALGGRKVEALKGLRRAFEHGYSPKVAQNDPELKGLQADPNFDKLLQEFTPKAN